ncbi:Uncharacterized protein DAT39_020681, partial [Clarias magur]
RICRQPDCQCDRDNLQQQGCVAGVCEIDVSEPLHDEELVSVLGTQAINSQWT